MGYFGLSHYDDSDMASDFVYTIINSIADECMQEITNFNGPYNTDGYINIALFAESFLMDARLHDDSKLIKVLIEVKKILEKDILNIIDEDAREGFSDECKAYTRMIKNLTKIINNTY